MNPKWKVSEDEDGVHLTVDATLTLLEVHDLYNDLLDVFEEEDVEEDDDEYDDEDDDDDEAVDETK